MFDSVSIQFQLLIVTLKADKKEIQMKLIVAASLVMFSAYGIAGTDRHAPKTNISSDVSLYYKNESNGDNQFTGFGTSILIKNERSHLGASFNTSVNNAEVIDNTGHFQEFIAWEAGVKLGYFSNVFFYGEAGFDLGEFIFDDRNETVEEYIYSGYDDFGHYYEEVETYYVDYDNDDNKIDAYVGIGAGIHLGNLTLEAFSRVRQIDGDYWAAPNTTYSGIQVSYTF